MNQELIENIEAYLEGDLSYSDLQAFAKEAGVENLDAEINWVKDIQIAIGADGLRSQLDEVLPKINQGGSKTSNIKPLRFLMAVAAAIAILVIGYFGWVRTGGNDLYAKYKFDDPGIPVVMGQSERYALDDALTYYGEGNYREAITRFKKLEGTDIGQDTVQYFLGLSYLYNSQSDLAKSSFQEVLETKTSTFRAKAEWMLVLSALQSKSYELASQNLKVILSQPDHIFYDEALSLSKDLENL